MRVSLRTATPGDLSHQPPDNADVHARLGAFREQPDHRPVADLRVVDDQVFLGFLDELSQGFARVDRADHNTVERRFIGNPLGIGGEELFHFADHIPVLNNQPETTAAVNIQVRPIESEQI
jgi:hypothetical protein